MNARTYLITGFALLAFLGLTIAAAYVNLGPFNTVAAMSMERDVAAKCLMAV